MLELGLKPVSTFNFNVGTVACAILLISICPYILHNEPLLFLATVKLEKVKVPPLTL